MARDPRVPAAGDPVLAGRRAGQVEPVAVHHHRLRGARDRPGRGRRRPAGDRRWRRQAGRGPDPGRARHPVHAAGSKPDDSKKENDVGVEVGRGIWFTPAKGWLPDPRSKSGRNYILQQFNVRGLIDGYYWVRQTELYDAKGFAEHLVDIESNGMQNVVIGKGEVCKPANEAIKTCYALNYTAKIKTSKNGLIDYKGFVTAYSDKWDRVTATDAGLEARVYERRFNQLQSMNASVEKSF
ncbi:hypothetical protein GCM10029976_019740 [Kribbella albertanoniae]